MQGRKNFSIFVVDAVAERRERLRMLLADFPCLISYCASPAEARAIMSGVGAHLVLCGLTEAELPVLELLEHVQRINPHCIRMIYGDVSPHAETVKQVSSGFAHRFVPYPRSEGHLGGLMAGVLALHEHLAPQKCLKYVEGFVNIGTLPRVIRDLEEVLIAPGCQADDLVAVLNRHPLIATRLLQLVNSAVFFKSAAIASLQQAVVSLGTGPLREIVLFLSAMEVFPQPEECRYQAIRVAVHSLQCSRLASYIAGQIVPGREEEAGTAALLHDIGKLAYFASDCPRYLEASSGPRDMAASPVEFEREVFGVSHAQMGGALLLWWNMPLSTIEAAVCHHLPLADLEGVAKCVAIADRFLLEAASKWKVMTDLQELPREYPLAAWRKIAWKLVNTLT